MAMKVLFVIGTRPEIIKCFPVYRELKKRGHKSRVFFTSQNFIDSLSIDIFKDFSYDSRELIFHKFSTPNTVIKQIGSRINEFKPDYVLVQGDTWSTLYGTMAALHTGSFLGHIEAGLRSGDKYMVEEKIRIIVDQVSDFLFAPTQIAFENIRKELGRKSYLVGNTIYDLLKNHKKEKPGGYILLTLHRPETVDNQTTFIGVLQGIREASKRSGLNIIFPAHPRACEKMGKQNIPFYLHAYRVKVMRPAGYLDFIKLLKKANLVMTDSGGVQEEAAILKVPCVTIRNNTERLETVNAGLNIVSGYSPEDISSSAIKVLSGFSKHSSELLYGDGNAGVKIVDILEENL